MINWCATQMPGIARRVMAEEADGRPADPYRRAWAEWVLTTAAPTAPQSPAAPAPPPTHPEKEQK